jgi:hypothetical protein
MSEPEPTIHDPQEPSPANHAVGGLPDNPPHDTERNNVAVIYPDPPAYFTDALDDAERLLSYAAENGIDVDDKTRSSILDARSRLARDGIRK